MTFVCETCGRRVDDPYERLERRIEFRRPINQGRYATYIDQRICTTCADAEIAEHRPQPNQSTLDVGSGA